MNGQYIGGKPLAYNICKSKPYMRLIHPVPHVTHVLCNSYLGALQAVIDGRVDEADGHCYAVGIPLRVITMHINGTQMH